MRINSLSDLTGCEILVRARSHRRVANIMLIFFLSLIVSPPNALARSGKSRGTVHCQRRMHCYGWT